MEFYLSRKQWIDTNPDDTTFAALVRAVRDTLGLQAQAEAPVVADERVYVEKKRYDSGIYTGYLVNGKADDLNGVIEYNDGHKYAGAYKNGSWHGQGTLTFPSGSRYVGEWKYGDRNGYGTLYNPDGTIEKQGQWKDGNFIG